MRALDRKLFRDLLHLRGQVIAVALVVACGIATFVTMRSAYESLLVTQKLYYRTFRFADVFAQLKRAPESVAHRIATIPGVTGVETRVIRDVNLDVPGLDEPATGRLISIPEQHLPMINDVFLRKGRWIEPGSPDEVIISESFANANSLDVGDALSAVINGRWQRLRIVGIGLSPEYVYVIRGADIFPDPKRFGVLWMGRRTLGPALNMEGAFNDVSLTLAAGADEQEVIEAVDRLLEQYGGLGAYGRSEQVSDQYLSNEIAGDRVTGTVLPAIFLAVAAFLVHVVLSRLVQTQRDQIAVMKAFGYSSARVGLHFLELSMAAVVAGSVLGIGAGIWLGSGLMKVYADFFQFPVLQFVLRPVVVELAVGISVVAAAAGAWLSVRQAVALPPAEAMRPEAPPVFHRGLLERMGVFRHLSTGARMIVRNMARRRAKAILSALGVAMAVGILVVGRYSFDAIDLMMRIQFETVQRENVTVPFNEPRGEEAANDIRHLPGVMHVETWRVVPVKLRAGHRRKRTGLIGVQPQPELRRIVDRFGRPVSLPPSGLVLSKYLADELKVRPGDTVTIEALEGERRTRNFPLTGVVDDLIGTSAYMDIRAVNHFMDEGRVISGTYLQVDPRRIKSLYGTLKQTPAVAGVAVRESMLASFKQTVAENLSISNTIIIFFACVIAAGVVYNGARIALSERGRELASLRVLGFSNAEVGTILLGEQAIITLISIPVGCTIGYWMSALVSRALSSELYRLPLTISSRTYAFAALVVIFSSIVSSIGIYLRIRRLDLVEVLKTRE
ncbi:MAG: FtsX-like permease family protein [Thermoanaerobaculia bacterium]